MELIELENKFTEINNLLNVLVLEIKNKKLSKNYLTKLKYFYENLDTVKDNLLDLLDDLKLDIDKINITEKLKIQINDQKEINKKLSKISPLLLYLFLNS